MLYEEVDNNGNDALRGADVFKDCRISMFVPVAAFILLA